MFKIIIESNTEILNEGMLDFFYSKVKQVMTSAKNLLQFLRGKPGIKEVVDVISSLVREWAPEIAPSETINEKTLRIEGVIGVNDVMMSVYKVVGWAGKALFKIMSFAGALRHPYSAIFEDENDLVDKLLTSNSVKIYKYLYHIMYSAEIPDKYICSYLILLASLSPFLFLITMISIKGSTDYTDITYYENPLLYGNKGMDPSTGFTEFEKKLLSMTKNLTDQYKDAETEFDKKYVLSIAMLKQTLILFISTSVIFIKISVGNGIFGSLFNVFQIMCLAYVTFILCANIVYSKIALDLSHKELKKTFI